MALKQEHRTKVNDRVRIKDSVTHMYPMARAYMEGTVRERKHDQLGYPLIFIQWDHDHWAYSGEHDRWVLEAHFDLVEDQMDDKENNLLKALARLVSDFQESDELDERKPEGKNEPSEDPRPDREYTYDEVLNMAMDEARDGEAFIVLVARPENFNGSEIIAPQIYMHQKSEDSAMVLEATMADVAAQTHARLAIKLINQAKADGSSGS